VEPSGGGGLRGELVCEALIPVESESRSEPKVFKESNQVTKALL
jgi:hypothetical protein